MASGGKANNIEVFPWLKTLPLAPEYHPTLAEFQDPIGYIFKIEKEASKYGICKIVPPVQPPPKKTAISNLNRSLAARSTSTNPKSMPTFTTRQQQIGFCPRKHRPVQKPVWQSGENYTLPQFEAKAKSFEKNYLKKITKKVLSPLEVETLYWKATVDKPFSVEYANDVPGSAFAQMSAKKSREAGESATVGETAWNMRGVSRAKGSLLRFMKEEIPGVTSPMVYVAMMFSWFAWHVEDHDLHSLNYMHMGAGKTWYGVPREAAVAFEEVIRVHGYGGEINPIVTFATLGEKTTVMSPEVLLSAGIPCCRLVQNAGEFVVTFPRAYHSGFSHGFNCGEAANIATPEWLRVANDAAIRRASINCPPMVSHFQLLYDLALSLSSRMPASISHQPRSSRLKDKKKGEGEALVKELFIQDVMQNNDLFHVLGKGSPIVLLPRNSFEKLGPSTSRAGGSESKVNPRMSVGVRSLQGKMKKTTESLVTEQGVEEFMGYNNNNSTKGKFSSFSDGNRVSLYACDIRSSGQYDRLPDRGLFSCVTCGILCFAGVAIIQPREAAARYLMSADCSRFNDWVVGSGVTSDGFADVSEDDAAELISCSGLMGKNRADGLFDVPIQSADGIQRKDESVIVTSQTRTPGDTSSLGLLALNYGDSSEDDDDHQAEEANNNSVSSEEDNNSREFSPVSRLDSDDSRSPSPDNYNSEEDEDRHRESYDPYEEEEEHERSRSQTVDCSVEFETNDLQMESNRLRNNQMRSPRFASNSSHEVDAMIGNAAVVPRSDEDSSRMHVFCLQHAVEVEQQLRTIGGVNMLLLCHPDYPELESEAKSVAEEMGSHHTWSKIEYRDADEEDKERIQSAVDSEEAIHTNGDWAVKLGVNLFYSANLSRSPLYSKQMPYNSVIYDAFGRTSPANTPTKPKGSGKQKKIVVAGKWCGKVWMSNQVHPLLVQRDPEEYYEPERNLHVPSKPDVNLERQSSQRTYSGGSNKRKKVVESRSSTVKAKYPKLVEEEEEEDEEDEEEEEPVQEEEEPVQEEDEPVQEEEEPVEEADSDDLLVNNTPHLQYYRRDFRNKRTKTETPQPPQRDIHNYDDDELEGGPSTRLRKRNQKPVVVKETIVEPKSSNKKPRQSRSSTSSINNKRSSRKGAGSAKAPAGEVVLDEEEGEYSCDMEGCNMSFTSKHDLVLHKRNVCPVKGCGKKFFSHKYLVQHRRVHVDDRPLKCPWKGCRMTFKWAWARTEHIRVHTGARPYACTEDGCGQTFRFVSDFSRHKRKTGHSTTKKGSNR